MTRDTRPTGLAATHADHSGCDHYSIDYRSGIRRLLTSVAVSNSCKLLSPHKIDDPDIARLRRGERMKEKRTTNK